MNQLLTMLGDGAGNTSMMRVVTFLVALAVLIPKIVLAVKAGTAPVWDAQDMEMLGVVLGAKLVQNQQENQPAKPEPPKA